MPIGLLVEQVAEEVERNQQTRVSVKIAVDTDVIGGI